MDDKEFARLFNEAVWLAQFQRDQMRDAVKLAIVELFPGK